MVLHFVWFGQTHRHRKQPALKSFNTSLRYFVIIIHARFLYRIAYNVIPVLPSNNFVVVRQLLCDIAGPPAFKIHIHSFGTKVIRTRARGLPGEPAISCGCAQCGCLPVVGNAIVGVGRNGTRGWQYHMSVKQQAGPVPQEWNYHVHISYTGTPATGAVGSLFAGNILYWLLAAYR